MEAKKMTVPIIMGMKQHEKIAALTAYDYLMALFLDDAGIDIILVGDSGAMVFGGHETTIPITMDEMIYHTRAASRGVKRALLVGDMPFLSFQVSAEEALRNAGRFIKEGGAEAVKMEGGEAIAETVSRVVNAGIPVMGHLGLTPQSINRFGGYKVQARSETEVQRLIADARALEQAGVFAIVLEKIPALAAKQVTEAVKVPTIGIGAGPYCDGQILVTHDMLGLFEKFRPKFVRVYAELGRQIREACAQYAEDVKLGNFPSAEESY
ncbi:MAG: 3-methyl-2-oxobutanoate hydroxymethyltransferase [candidate division KSB1 bacterium]|nr:3-methyl-2-oxobutanoate hydroxymethyltransferase [candidate division KSB1 bacterium]MDZ7334464.1 3-methyl-2-oxobutanoate hydroxymethyltransferase [candidate division KSB1 bacterium]MDZ7355991.1 3-methyl-2-oxobutanoate hydroxymethyltransferase [candidate division KSB1 bacterium]MDZ7377446.1 3-methyl-2-oxobutanoate hydroxymethyltransferase [candidate division KSB1 bacterium]MDZ7400675.1 3-methyl-2-oxobutanoate hydroxymethyltransferase [candidate division KSB1 bacterium]